MCGVLRTTCWVGFPTIWELNSDHQAWGQVLLLAEPSHLPHSLSLGQGFLIPEAEAGVEFAALWIACDISNLKTFATRLCLTTLECDLSSDLAQAWESQLRI